MKTLLLGASHSDYPVAEIIKSCGHTLFTAGTYKNGLANVLSDFYYPVDYAHLDACIELVSALRPDYVVPSANDFSYLTVVRICEKLYPNRFDSYEVSKILHYKDLFRLYCEKHSISSPRLYQVVRATSTHEVNPISFPCMVKSVDLTGGKGIALVTNQDELNSSIIQALNLSPRKICVIEEYLPAATLFSLSSFYRNGELEDCYLDQETLAPNSFGVSSSTWPTTKQVDIKHIVDQLSYICRDLTLKPGLVHAQIVESYGRLYIIEITRRLPGDLYSLPVQAALGIPHVQNALSYWLPGVSVPELSLYTYLPGLDVSRLASISRFQAYSAEQLSALQIGLCSSYDYVTSFVKGERLNSCSNDSDRKGVVFAASYLR